VRNVKLDYEIIRDILLKIENCENNKIAVSTFCNDIYDEKIISYHIALLLDVNYIEATPLCYIGSNYTDYIVKRMTMQGHQYLDSIRDNKIWEETKNTISKTTSSVSLDIVKAVALKIACKFLGV